MCLASSSPAPSDEDTHAQHQSSSTDKHSDAIDQKQLSNDRPSSVNQKSALNQNYDSTKPNEEGIWYADPDWWVAGFTGALFVATVGL